MKVHTLTADELGIKEIPPGRFRLAGPLIENCDNPDLADVILSPVILYNLQRLGVNIRGLPYMARHSFKHLFFDCADNFDTFPGLNSMFLRCCLRQPMLKDNSRSLCVAWPTSSSNPNREYDAVAELPPGGFRYHVSARMWDSCRVRHDSTVNCAQALGGLCDHELLPTFTGYCWDTPEGLRRRKEFQRSIHESLMVLAPRSIPGVFPYRFFEAMLCGRMPVLFCDEYVWPRPDKVDWDNVCVALPESAAPRAGEIVKSLVDRLGAPEIVERGRRARRAYLDYLDDRKWPEIHAEMAQVLLGMR